MYVSGFYIISYNIVSEYRNNIGLPLATLPKYSCVTHYSMVQKTQTLIHLQPSHMYTYGMLCTCNCLSQLCSTSSHWTSVAEKIIFFCQNAPFPMKKVNNFIEYFVALMFSIQRLHQILFKNVISIITYPYWLRSATMMSVQRLHQLISVKFITTSKATKE